MAKRDYYEILGLTRDAPRDDIKKAYRKLAIQYHPDRNAGDTKAEELFKEASEAYEILSDDKKRQAYDQFGFAGLEGMGASGSHDFSNIFKDFGDFFGDSGFFDSFFAGGRKSHNDSARGSDLRYDLRISFRDAAFGTKTEINYIRRAQCSDCKGRGHQHGTGRHTCGNCGGIGQIRRSSGFFSIASPCSQCNGKGTIIDNPCKTCRGLGRVDKNTRIKVSIPPGMESGKRINISGQGNAGKNNAPSGDLYVFVNVEPHKYYERDGADLYCVIPIGVVQATLGTKITVPNLDGKRVKLNIPSGTQHGKMFRLRHEGLPRLQDPSYRGDLYIKIQIQTPKHLNLQSRSLLQELSRIEGFEEAPEPLPLKDL